MTDIQSKEVIDKVSQDLKIQPSMAIPRTLGKDIQLVYSVNPFVKAMQVKGNSLVDGTSATIFTTHPTKKTFITGIQITVSKDVVSTSIFSQVLGSVLTAPASSSNLFLIRYEPVTANQFTNSFDFTQPIEMVPNTAVTLVHSNGTASIDGTAVIYFYEEDPE